MSVSSRKLKAIELPNLRYAQIKAADIAAYPVWLNWMRSTYSYALAVRMAVYMGFKVPNHGFYMAMRKAGMRLGKVAA